MKVFYACTLLILLTGCCFDYSGRYRIYKISDDEVYLLDSCSGKAWNKIKAGGSLTIFDAWEPFLDPPEGRSGYHQMVEDIITKKYI